MLSLKNLQIIKTMGLPKTLLTLLILFPLIFPAIASSESHPCQNATVQLRGDLDVLMNRGGLWALMEQTEGLQDKSVLGFQADGKLARAVGRFESLCESEKKPTKQLFDDLVNLLGEARAIWNPRSSGEEILSLINGVKKKVDSMLSTIE
tara:strand:+ start:2411 stop:2860 length:450 start_codon:yes stop_codon:yes gene_type:complete